MDRTLTLLAALLLAGCAIGPPPETPEQTAQRHDVDCTAAGFSKDSESYRLCLLIQEQNDRLATMDLRLNRIESQTLNPGPFYPWRW